VTGSTQTLPVVAGGRKGKDDRKQNTLAPLVNLERMTFTSPKFFIHFGKTEKEGIFTSSLNKRVRKIPPI
jgi:hypothetical protein